MLNTLDKTDLELKNDVLSELKYEPSIKVTDIGVLVKDGIVTLTGYTTSFNDKLTAVHAVKRVAGLSVLGCLLTERLLLTQTIRYRQQLQRML